MVNQKRNVPDPRGAHQPIKLVSVVYRYDLNHSADFLPTPYAYNFVNRN